MTCTTHHHACDCREAEFTELKAENETLRRRLHDQALRTYDGLVEENARLQAAEQMYAQQTSQLIDEVKRLKEALSNLYEID